MVSSTQPADEPTVETAETADAHRVFVLPTSFAQRGLWFLHQLDPSSPAYGMLVPLRVDGPFDPALFVHVLDHLVARHEALRTVFGVVDDEPVQLVAPEARAAVTRVELDGLPAGRRRQEARRLAAAEARRPFDLAHGPLLRTTLVRSGPTDHLLLIALHHAVSDGRSVSILIHEAAVLVEAFAAGRPSPLPPLEIQYGDYCAWQRESVAAGDLDRHLAYWRRQLAELPPRLELPAHRPRTVGDAAATRPAGTCPVRIEPPMAERLRGLVRSRNATPYAGLLAAFQALLGRTAGQEHLAVGSPVAGRTRPEVQGVVGMFVHTLVMRGDLSGRPGFGELVERCRDVTLSALAHQDVPLEKVVEAVAPERQGGSTPLFETLFAFQGPSVLPKRLGDAAVTALESGGGAAKFDLTLRLEEHPDGGFAGELEYAADRFDQPSMARMAGHFERLLATAVEAPEIPFHRLPMLSDVERAELLAAGGGEPLAHSDILLHQLFAHHAERCPEAPAAVSARGELSYRRLAAAARRLAWRLRERGAKPERRVAILAEPGLEMVIALIATLGTGAAYVPLDPGFPHRRLAHILAEARAVAVVTVAEHRQLAADLGAEVIVIDAADEPGSEAGPPPLDVGPDQVAYTIWTSGSTGDPKGVDVPHRQAVAYLRALVERLDLPVGARYAMVQPLAVDASNTVLLPALFSGGTLLLLPRSQATDAAAVAELFARHRPDVLKIAPSHLAALLDASDSPHLLPRRLLVLGGEGSRRDWIERAVLPRLGPDARAVIHYGPTETTVGVLTHPVESIPGRGPLVPLGRPLPGSAVHVTGPELELVPVGTVGEIHIGGEGVARGYLERPGLTASRFLPDPHTPTPGRRVYRTGDLARWLPGAAVEFLGRTDHQVKIRGFRVELGEVESVLAAHPRVARAVVLAREHGGERHLVAYGVAVGEPTPSPGALRTWLAERLPDHMVPAAVVLLDALPVNAQGKVAADALPDPAAQEVVGAGHTLPGTLLEARIAAVWEEVLGLAEVPRDADFFALGGHSLLTVRLLGALGQRLGVRVGLADFLADPTVAGLAARIGSAEATVDGGRVRLAEGEGDGTGWVLVHPIGGHVACYLPLARRLRPTGPVDAFEARREPPRESIGAMAAAYLAELDDRPDADLAAAIRLAGWSLGGLVAWEMAARLEARGDQVERLVLLDCRPPGEPEGELPILLRFAADLAGTLGWQTTDRALDLLAADPREQRSAVLATLADAGLPWSGDELDRAVDVYRAHAAAARSYRPRPIAAAVDLVLAPTDDDPDVRQAWSERWSRWAGGGLCIHSVDAHHHSILRPPAIEAVAALMSRSAGPQRSADPAGSETP